MKKLITSICIIIGVICNAQSQDWIVGTWSYCCVANADSMSSQSLKLIDYRMNGSLYSFRSDSTCFSILNSKRSESKYAINAAQDTLTVVHPKVTYRLEMEKQNQDTLQLYYANIPVLFVRIETTTEPVHAEDIEK